MFLAASGSLGFSMLRNRKPSALLFVSLVSTFGLDSHLPKISPLSTGLSNLFCNKISLVFASHNQHPSPHPLHKLSPSSPLPTPSYPSSSAQTTTFPHNPPRTS